MGCVASRVANEDTVRRCKERRRLMKEAVQSRHLLASAHADYLRSLCLTASSLSRFASGEPFLSVSDLTPPVLIDAAPHPRRSPPVAPETVLRGDRCFLQAPDADGSEIPAPSPAPSMRRFASSAPPVARTPSQLSSSSAWDWENFYPPSPPDSDFFDRRKAQLVEEAERHRRYHQHHLKEADEEGEEEDDDDDDEEEEDDDNRDCSDGGNHEATKGVHYRQSEVDDGEQDHFGSSTTSSEGGKSRSDYMSSYGADRSEISGSVAPPPTSARRKERSEVVPSLSSAITEWGEMAPEKRMVVRHRTLSEISAAIEEYFLKAAAAGDHVTELLEAGRAQLDRDFQQLKKTLHHSSNPWKALASSWTSRPPLEVRYSLDAADMVEVSEGGGRSHGATLERLLAWEKKLYAEVKARESVKVEHEKKLRVLQRQEYRGKDDARLDKIKVTIKKLQSLIIVTSQAVITTSTAITRVRDDELAPQLVNLCLAFLNMWRSMHRFHEIQSSIAQQVRGLTNRAAAGEATSDLHRMATRDLELAVSCWHSSFARLVKHQRDYIRSLYGWLKLTLLQINHEDQPKDHSSPVALELTGFCDEWKQALDRLPDTVASEAIKSFASVVHVIHGKQMEEVKVKKKVETYSKELEKKAGALRALERKYYRSYSTVGLTLPGNGHNGDISEHMFDSRDPLAEKKAEIAACRRKVEEETARHGKAVEATRSMTVNSIQTGLPSVFQAMMGFSGVTAESMEVVCRRAGSVQ